jgi:hypothetical protein
MLWSLGGDIRKGTGDSTFRALLEEPPTPDSEDSRLFDQEYRRQLLG